MAKKIIRNLGGLDAREIVVPQREKIKKEKKLWKERNPF